MIKRRKKAGRFCYYNKLAREACQLLMKYRNIVHQMERYSILLVCYCAILILRKQKEGLRNLKSPQQAGGASILAIYIISF